MTTLNVPSISKKKPMPACFESDSFRLFGNPDKYAPYRRPDDVPQHAIKTFDKTLNLPSWYYNSHYEPERNIRDRNRCEVTYLRRNVRTLNDPVCYVPSKQEGDHWWPSRVPPLNKPTPEKPRDSTMRADYDWTDEHRAHSNTRHKNNVTRPALGTVPVNFLPEKDGNQRFYKEKISYEHQYDSRWEDNYPIRSRRHGAYVSKPISGTEARQLLANSPKWRTDTEVKDPSNMSPNATTTEFRDNKRTYTQPNHRRRENFDIAPRSNLNVRIREYIPSAMESAARETTIPQNFPPKVVETSPTAVTTRPDDITVSSE